MDVAGNWETSFRKCLAPTVSAPGSTSEQVSRLCRLGPLILFP
jgi:hypothetical protein